MTTVICGHQPNFLPYPGFFHKMIHCDRFVFVDDVEFVGKGPFGWIHRNKVRIHNKDEHWLTVPVRTTGRFHQDIKDVRIVNDEPWTRKHWKTIRLNYKDTPFFDRYSEELENIYDQTWEKLVDLNLRMIEFFRDALDIQTPTSISSNHDIDAEGSELILSLCDAFSGDVYLSGVHGRDYLDRERIEESEFEILFQDFESPEYPQPYDNFVPNLSTLDLLFNCGPDSRETIAQSGTLTKSWGSPVER